MARSWWHSPASRTGALAAGLLLAAQAAAWVGGEPGAYLRAPVGATAFAMGAAGCASPDYLASWWNPAMLSVYRSRRAALGMGVRSMGRMEGFGAFDFRIPPRVGMGFSLLYRGDPFLDDLRDANENPIDDGSYTTLTLKTGLSYFINRRWSAGANLGIFYQREPTASQPDGSLVYSSATGIGGFSLALRWQARERWSLALLGRNLLLPVDWTIEGAGGEGGGQASADVAPDFVLASKREGRLLGRAFVWTSDLVVHALDADWSALPHPEAFWNNGFEWHAWQTFYLRLGLGELPLNGNLTGNSSVYFDEFSARITGGFAWELRRIREGLWVNYGLSTDKVWEGIDQVLDITYAF